MLIYYYEQIAAEICDTLALNLFKGTIKGAREQEVVLARQFCMVYRCEFLHMTEKEAGKRYLRDHSSVSHAKTDIEDYKKTSDYRYKKYLQFLAECDSPNFGNKDENYRFLEDSIHLKISEVGMKTYINQMYDNFSGLVLAINTDENEKQIQYLIEVCHHNMHELKVLYEQ